MPASERVLIYGLLLAAGMRVICLKSLPHGKCPRLKTDKQATIKPVSHLGSKNKMLMTIKDFETIRQIWPSKSIVTQNDDFGHKSLYVNSQRDETEKRST